MRTNLTSEFIDVISRNWVIFKLTFLTVDPTGVARINRYVMLAWLAIVGFPLYYYMWTVVYPQPYESGIIRMVGGLIALPLLFSRKLLHYSWFKPYFFCAFVYMFPFFFTFMYLMNGANLVWSMAFLVMAMAVTFLDFKVALTTLVTGGLVACLSFDFVRGSHPWPAPQIAVGLPILGFGITTIMFMKMGTAVRADENLQGMASALAIIAHELRTPLRSIDANSRGLKKYFPVLLNHYKTHLPNDARSLISASRLHMMEEAVDRIDREVNYMNSSIDLLLANSLVSNAKNIPVETISIRRTVEQVLERYPYETAEQKALVTFQCDDDFEYSANEDLSFMVFVNLLKNAFRAVSRANKGNVTIRSYLDEGRRTITFRDTGCGIAFDTLPFIFDRFFSYPVNASTGIGLAFCRQTLQTWGARITCRSAINEYTEFTIRFKKH